MTASNLLLALAAIAGQSPPQASDAPATGQVEPPPSAGLLPYLRPTDYPPEALRNREQGTVAFRVTVGPRGRVTDCTITSSSGSFTLDRATCLIARQRLRYAPARDAEGNPVAAMSPEYRVTWLIPD